jgi:hypothetical protein
VWRNIPTIRVNFHQIINIFGRVSHRSDFSHGLALHTTAAYVAVFERGEFSCSVENCAGSVGGV